MGLFLLTHSPKVPGVAPRIPQLDKLVHAALFCGLTLLGGRALRLASRPGRLRKVALWALIYAGYAAADEWLQQFVGRTPDLLDWLADGVGIVAGSAILLLRVRRSPTP